MPWILLLPGVCSPAAAAAADIIGDLGDVTAGCKLPVLGDSDTEAGTQ